MSLFTALILLKIHKDQQPKRNNKFELVLYSSPSKILSNTPKVLKFPNAAFIDSKKDMNNLLEPDCIVPHATLSFNR